MYFGFSGRDKKKQYADDVKVSKKLYIKYNALGFKELSEHSK